MPGELEEHAGIDYPGQDLEEQPCASLVEAKKIALPKIGSDPDRSAAWCAARKRLWIKHGALQ
eukprot:CAMPEP_0195128226 /NCGR_PEP_ID=MMETSP0448-20130528/138736_1 /TAXON_ID=66468 /ORGANISM="Heterocapsa triquestra, Strain CCMP 448" /LENGTH=62 /DNA_ID=CAMNT_0040166013 /DNA_START=28 /DNA_END=213 /DNA_ORIENTATION=-